MSEDESFKKLLTKLGQRSRLTTSGGSLGQNCHLKSPGNPGGHFWNDLISVFKASIFYWVVSLDNQRKEFLTNIVVSLGEVLPHFKKLATQFRTSCLVLEDANSREWAIFDAVPLTVSTQQCLKTFPNIANIQVFLLGSSLSVWRFIIYICWAACQADAGVADLWRHVKSCSKERLTLPLGPRPLQYSFWWLFYTPYTFYSESKFLVVISRTWNSSLHIHVLWTHN